MRLYKLMSVFILATATENGLAESYYESNSTTWKNITCTLGEPQLKYQDGLFEINETFTISDDVWIGYLYVQQADFLCICVMEYSEKHDSHCKGGDRNRLCDGCYEIYTQINVNASHVIGSGNGPEGDCLTNNNPYFKWQPCSRTDVIPSLCSNATYTDPIAIATIEVPRNGQWSTGNKLCLTHGLHPSFERSITNSVFGEPQKQYYWTGIIKSNILMKLSLKDMFSRFSTERYVFLTTSNKILHVASNAETKRALCVQGTESTSTRYPATSKFSTEMTTSITASTYSHTSVVLTSLSTSDGTTNIGSKSSMLTTPMYTTIHLETTEHTKEVMPSITQSTYSETSVFLTKVTSPDVSTTVGSKSSMATTSGKSSALGVGIGVSVGILFLVGAAVVIVVLKRRGILPCNRNTGKNKPSENETGFKENLTDGKSIANNVAHHNYFVLETFDQSMGKNAEHYTESNESNMEEDYNTIHETEEPYKHVQVENCDYDYTTNAIPSGADARQPENVYNKLKINRSGDDGRVQRHGLSVVQISDDDYDSTSAVLNPEEDDGSDYNHITRTIYKAGATSDDIKCGKGGDYDAINNMKFKVSKSDDSDYAHVNKDQIE